MGRKGLTGARTFRLLLQGRIMTLCGIHIFSDPNGIISHQGNAGKTSLKISL